MDCAGKAMREESFQKSRTQAAELHFSFRPNSVLSGCKFKSQSQLWFSGSALGQQNPT